MCVWERLWMWLLSFSSSVRFVCRCWFVWWVEWAVDDYTIRNAAWVCMSVYVMVGLRIGFIPYQQMKGNLWVWMWTWTKQTQHFHFTLSSHDCCTLNNNNNCRRATSHGNFFWSSPFDLVRAICSTEQGLVQKQLFVIHRSERCMTTANESHIKPVRRAFRFILKLQNFEFFFWILRQKYGTNQLVFPYTRAHTERLWFVLMPDINIHVMIVIELRFFPLLSP